MARSSGSIHVADNSVTSINDAIQQLLFQIDELRGEHDTDSITVGPHSHASSTTGGTISHDTGLTDVSANDHHNEDHQARHNSGGADALKLDDLAAPDDNTDLNASASAHGLLPKLSGNVGDAFRGDGTFGQVGGVDSDFVDGYAASPLWEYPGIGEGEIYVTIDGGGATITTGVKGDLYIPYDITLTYVTMLADQASSSIVVDIWVDTIANHPPTVADTITASDKPTISNAISSQDNNISTWTRDVNGGSVMRFNVDSRTTIQRLQMTLGYVRRGSWV